MWSIAGIAAARVVGLLPWAGPRTMLALLYVALAVMAIGGPVGAVWLHMHGVKREAVNIANAACELRISENAAASAESLARVLATIRNADDAAPEPKTKAEELALCHKSKLCRENGK